MPSTIPDLLDAIAAKLTAADFSPLSVTVERAFIPRRSVKEMGATIWAAVTPRSVALERLSRISDTRRIVVDVGIQKRLEDAANDSEVDGLINLAQSVHGLFRGEKLIGAEDMTWTAGDTPTFFSGEHFDEYTVFTAVVALTYSQTT